jgi:thiamine biosynthesis lipoprotein ApbE
MAEADPTAATVVTRRVGAARGRALPERAISRLRAAGGKATGVSADTYRVIDLALAAWRATDGCSEATHLEETAA